MKILCDSLERWVSRMAKDAVLKATASDETRRDTDRSAVATELTRLVVQIVELQALVRPPHLDVAVARKKYAELKAGLRIVCNRDKATLTSAEQAFLMPAVQHAITRLSAATNTPPRSTPVGPAN